MRVTIDVEIQEFTVPRFVLPVPKAQLKQDALSPAIGIPLEDLDAKVLDQLCRNFRDRVFKTAGKPDPEVFK